ncbi:DUF6941 family protein [Nesterenkonia lacusekhoensis]|uniref:RecJ OB domain-containing protein n=1 Tax=Nesterenkonia lacusekhoensis TaxID=150832 RepID=A0ABS4T513_9MICC|nr:hypothetical protein [Nesterenkonia lacusekhoensis]MBP2319544.1 hypothetical protein [Nesterenkonia lacusekhoensis]
MDSTELQPDLDYAFLAEYARAEGNSLTAIGASFTQIDVPQVPAQFMLYVAGRIRAKEAGDPFPLSLRVGPDDASDRIQLETSLDPKSAVHPYRGRVGIIFAVGIPLGIDVAGLHRVDIVLGEEQARTLYFSVNDLASDGLAAAR